MNKENIKKNYFNNYFVALFLISLVSKISSVIPTFFMNYLSNESTIYYINPLSNSKGDIYFEFWGGTTTRYIYGLKSSDFSEMFSSETNGVKSVTVQNITNYHDSIIVEIDGNEDYIFSIATYQNVELINMNNNNYFWSDSSSKIGENNIDQQDIRSALIRLSNGYYLIGALFPSTDIYNMVIYLFKLTSSSDSWFSQVGGKNIYGALYLSKTSCFETSNS